MSAFDDKNIKIDYLVTDVPYLTGVRAKGFKIE